jgi:hypothetical protein
VLDQPNVILGIGNKDAEGSGAGSPYILKPQNDNQNAVIEISAGNVRLQNIKVQSNGSNRFNHGILSTVA